MRGRVPGKSRKVSSIHINFMLIARDEPEPMLWLGHRLFMVLVWRQHQTA